MLTSRPTTDSADGAARARPTGVLESYERMLAASSFRGRQVALPSNRLVHALEAGEGPPALLLHGSTTSSLSLLPLLDELAGVRAIAVDRPGFGLSDTIQVPRERFRAAAVEFIEGAVDALGLERPVLAGNSMGGTWALWYALAHPDRVGGLVLLGSAPLLPGSHAPVPLRVAVAPVLGDLLPRVARPNARMIVRLMSSMGERDTIVRYPDLIDALVAAADDPIASSANLAELRAVLTPIGFRPSSMVRPDELRGLSVPALLIWGDRDPVASVRSAQATARLIPDARLEVLPGGHVPYLGHPGPVSELLAGFVRARAAERDADRSG
jgi:pimeloyl-ACP methyl ester carboxylesterase